MLMIVLSILPIGSTSDLGARRSDSILQGQTLDAVIVLTVGILVIGIIDNFLRPRLIGKDSKMSDYLGLVSLWVDYPGFP